MQVKVYALGMTQTGAKLGDNGKLSIRALRNLLKERAQDSCVSPACKAFILELGQAVNMGHSVPGRAAGSRKTVLELVQHFGKHELPRQTWRQRMIVRRLQPPGYPCSGENFSGDHSWRSVKSLGSADPEARDSQGRAKHTPVHASLFTLVGLFGLVFDAPLVPNEQQELCGTVISGTYQGPVPDYIESTFYHQMLCDAAAAGGPPRVLPNFVCVDHVVMEQNLWARITDAARQGCTESGIDVLVPAGAFT